MIRRNVFAISLAFCFAATFCLTAAEEGSDRFSVTPEDTGEALNNPDMGWTCHFYSNVPQNYGSKLEPSDTLEDFPGVSTVYLRVPWAFIEPQEGRFNWALLDTPAQRFISKGKRVAFRITCSENWMRFATPEWVRNAGAKGCFYEFGKGPSTNGTLWDPDFEDPIFLEKLDHFLSAMAARYDGNPNVAFIDIGSFGLWGECHTHMSSQTPADRVLPIIKQHIDLHVRHFHHTLLCIGDDAVGHDKPGRHFPATDYALSKGVTLRDDSIMVQPPPNSWYHAEMAQEFWPHWPVVLEHEHFGSSKARNAWGDGSLLLKAVEDYHASYLSIHWWPHEFLEANRALVDRINRRLGYRIQLHSASWPKVATIGKPFQFDSAWANAGVAPAYPGGFIAVTLKDVKGGLVAVMTDESFDIKSLKTGPTNQIPEQVHSSQLTAGLIAPTTKPGEYSLYISIGSRDGTPAIALPLANNDGQKRYLLGKITLKNE